MRGVQKVWCSVGMFKKHASHRLLQRGHARIATTPNFFLDYRSIHAYVLFRDK